MNRKTIIGLSACFVLSVLAVAGLIGMSMQLKLQHNSFLRLFPPHPVLEGDTLVLPGHGYYIAGSTSHTAYLGNVHRPLHLLQVDLHTLDTVPIPLVIDNIFRQKFWATRIVVDSPRYYLYDGSIPVIYRGSVESGSGEMFRHDSIYFMDLAFVDTATFAVRAFSGKNGENMLGKLMPGRPGHVFTENILTRQVDGVFCTDGMLRFDRESGKLVYLYYFRNEFIVMDTSLHVILRSQTIDTVRHARIQTKLLANGTRMLSAPPYYVNLKSQVYDNRLFVYSNLMAANEHESVFRKAAVLDVYDLAGGTYRFSFYVFDYPGRHKLKDFHVGPDFMTVLYEDRLQVFTIDRRLMYAHSQGEKPKEILQNQE